jgi:hypothetical protein
MVRALLDLDGGAYGAFGALAMSGAAFLRIKKLKGGGIITVAARHNKREIQAELGAAGSIDPTRSHLNYSLTGPAAGDVGQLAKDLMTAAGVTKLRKDAVQALEIVFSLPPGHSLDDPAYFTDCAAWAGHHLGGVILSVDIHRDEAAPHCHVLLLPLIGGRMAGSDMLGGKQKLAALQKDFFDQVAAAHGLSKAPARLAGASKQAAAKAVLQTLRDTGDKAQQSKVWATLRDVIERDPAPFLLALGIELQAPEKKLKTYTQIMTSKGKGSAKEANPIGFTPPEKRQTLCSVGFTPKPPPPQALPGTHDLVQIDASQMADPPFIETTTRHRDCDQTPDRYDPESGDFIPIRPPTARSHRQAADDWVNKALASKQTARARWLQHWLKKTRWTGTNWTPPTWRITSTARPAKQRAGAASTACAVEPGRRCGGRI